MTQGCTLTMKKFIAPLQGLRGVAAILVVLFHINGLLNAKLASSAFFGLFKSGCVGVDIFFVLSGFIIFYVNHQKTSLTRYFQHRFIRIFPIYWVALSLTLSSFLIMKYLFVLPPGYLANALSQGGCIYIAKCYLLIPNPTPILNVSWTLSFEILFYLIFALYFWRPLLFYSVFMLWVALAYYHQNELFNPIIVEFLIGCIIARAYINNFNHYAFTALFVGLCIFICSSYFYVDQHRELYFGIPAALIIYGLLQIRTCPEWLMYLGDASYSIYLFHFPILGFLMKFFGSSSLSPTMIGIIIFLTTVIICLIIYRYIEQPLLDYLRRFNISNRYKILMQHPRQAC